jgi:predicted DNA binding CopG/RHH family protein
MKQKIKYSNEPTGTLKAVRDFLPPPDKLAIKEDRVKVTISLSKKSVDFFKGIAREHHTSYQKMIRRVIDIYSSHYGTGA